MSTTVSLAPPLVGTGTRVAPATVVAGRLSYLDAYRGLLTVLMALDHAVYFLWSGATEHTFTFWNGPFESSETWPELVIRLASNLAAPGFFLLLGTCLVMFARGRQRLGWTDEAVSMHFVRRGALLVVMQFLVENPLWSFGSGAPWVNYVGVLFALGAAMICSALIWRLPSTALVALGTTLVVLQEIVLRTAPQLGESLPPWLALLLVPGRGGDLLVYFPCLPWLGITAWGIVLGRRLMDDRRHALTQSGVAGAGLFAVAVVITALGGFGNIGVVETGSPLDLLCFVKYGPSAAFAAWNVGLTLMALPVAAWVMKYVDTSAGPLVSFGRSALFFYVAHLFLFGLIAQLQGPDEFSLSQSLAIWFLGLLVLWPACNYYGRFKIGTKPDSVWRLF